MSLRMSPVHVCDMCDERREPAELRRLRTEAVITSERIRTVSADICRQCQARPIAELLGQLDRIQGEKTCSNGAVDKRG